MRLLIRWLITAIAVWVAVLIVPGIDVRGEQGWLAILLMAAALGFVNIFIKPLLTIISCGLIAVTLGLFLFVVNAAAFWIASWLTLNFFNVGIVINGFWPALWGSIIVSVVAFVLTMFLPDED